MELQQFKFSSPLGDLFLTASAKGITGLYSKPQKGVPFDKNQNKGELRHKDQNKSSSISASKILKEAGKQLEKYFAHKLTNFDLPLDLEGTPFQQDVWKELQKIPYGKTISYAELAQKIKKPKACRAVGNANGKNPVWIIVPCHRVIATDGSLGGYSGGLNIKKYLLKLEQQS